MLSPSRLAPIAWPVLLLAATAFVAVELAATWLAARAGGAGAAGYHPDELYFLACGRRLAWGYVDQPPLTPALARVVTALLGDTLPALRLVPALAGAGTLVLAGLSARELGGGRAAQALAAVALAASPLTLGVNHVHGTTPLDYLAWALVLWLTTRLLRTGDRRLWLAIGVAAGIGLLNKHNVLFLGAALVIGLLVTTRRRLLAGPWPWAGAALALALWSPNLAWNAANGWPAVRMLAALTGRNHDHVLTLVFLPGSLAMHGPLVAVWVVGLAWLARTPAARPFRPLVWAFAVLLALFLVLGGQTYYAGGFYPVLFAAGAVAAEAWWRRTPAAARGWDRLQRRPAVLATNLLLAGALTAPMSLPLLPVPVLDVTGQLAATRGWPQFAAATARARDALPAAERPTAQVLAADYGTAGTLEHYGPALGLPAPVSAHNNYWLWGPPPGTPATVIAVGFADPVTLRRAFADVRELTVWHAPGPDGRRQPQDGHPIYACRGPRGTWAQLWPTLAYLDERPMGSLLGGDHPGGGEGAGSDRPGGSPTAPATPGGVNNPGFPSSVGETRRAASRPSP